MRPGEWIAFVLFISHGIMFFAVTLFFGYSPDRAFLLRYLIE